MKLRCWAMPKISCFPENKWLTLIVAPTEALGLILYLTFSCSPAHVFNYVTQIIMLQEARSMFLIIY